MPLQDPEVPTHPAGRALRDRPARTRNLPGQVARELPEVKPAREKGRGWLIRRLLVLADLCGLSLAFTLTEVIFGSEGGNDALTLWVEVAAFAAMLPLWVVAATMCGLYQRDEEVAYHSTADDLGRVFLFVTVGAFAITNTAMLFESGGATPSKVIFGWAAAVLLVTLARRTARAVSRRHPTYRQFAIIVGTDRVAQSVHRKLTLHREYGIDPIGFVDDVSPASAPLAATPLLGGLEDLPGLVDRHDVERVIFGFHADRNDVALELIRRLRDSGVRVDIVPRMYELVGPKIEVHQVAGLPLLGLGTVKLPRATRLAKRALDVVIATTTLVLTAPLFVVLGVLIRLDSSGPVFFRQERLGKDQRPFRVYKFRTMKSGRHDADHEAYISQTMQQSEDTLSNGVYKLDRSDIVTRVGRWLRSTSIDELPQLFNVLRGEMSIVGPRPCLAYELQHFERHHFDRFLVPAGMTGLWQVSARARSSFGEALELDVLYAHSCSVALDLRLIARTPFEVLRSKVTA